MLIRGLSRVFIFWPGRKSEADVKHDFFTRALHLPNSFFQKIPYGEIVSRLSNDITAFRLLCSFGILQALNLAFLLSFSFYHMIKINFKLAVISTLPLVLMLFVTRLFAPLIHKYSKIQQEKLGSFSQIISEALTNVSVIQANDAINSFMKIISAKTHEVSESNIRLITIRTLLFPLSKLFVGLSFLIVLFYGGKEIIAGKLTIGDLLAFNLYLSMLSFPLMALGITLAIYQRAKVAINRIYEIQSAETEDGSSSTKVLAKKNDDEHNILSIKNLSFCYPKNSINTITNFSLNIKIGQKIGITGPIASGKSTLIHLITRLLSPPKNTIFFDGNCVTSLDLRYLRNNLGVCLQKSYLFSDSIRANISLGNKAEYSLFQIKDSAKKAQINDEIERMELSWDTPVGEGGVRLSGGQKQRIALSRLFLKNKRFVILDDATYAIDKDTESRLLPEIKKVKTLLLVSHKPELLNLCDKVIVLKNGHTFAQGTFKELQKLHPEIGFQSN